MPGTKRLGDLTLRIVVVAFAPLSAGSASGAENAAYVTNFAGQGPTARLAYLATDGHIRELYFVASAGTWGTADVTGMAGAANAAAALVAYVTTLTGRDRQPGWSIDAGITPASRTLSLHPSLSAL